MLPYFAFRKAQTAQELEALLRLQYTIYKESRMKDFVVENPHGFNLDSYDLYATHFGLFLNNQIPVGYHRIVGDHESCQRALLNEIVTRYPDFQTMATQERRYPLPVMTYHPEPSQLMDFWISLKKEGQMIIEATKFAIDPSISTLSLAKHLTESEFASGFYCQGVDFAITVCTTLHSRFYSRYGFRKILAADFAVNGLMSSCIGLAENNLPDEVRHRILKMAEAYAATGCICYYQHHDDYFFPPEDKGDENCAFQHVCIS